MHSQASAPDSSKPETPDIHTRVSHKPTQDPGALLGPESPGGLSTEMVIIVCYVLHLPARLIQLPQHTEAKHGPQRLGRVTQSAQAADHSTLKTCLICAESQDLARHAARQACKCSSVPCAVPYTLESPAPGTDTSMLSKRTD